MKSGKPVIKNPIGNKSIKCTIGNYKLPITGMNNDKDRNYRDKSNGSNTPL
jgi:hypothetical protein